MLKSKKFWSYEISNQFSLTEEVLASAKKRGKFYEDALFFFEMMGTGPHPSLKSLQGNSSPTSINFNNVLVDINTIKILFHLLPNSKVNTLKFSNNNFNLKSLECLMNYLATKENSIGCLSYEWNDEIYIDDIKYSYKDIKNIQDEKLLQDMKKSQNLLVDYIINNPTKLEVLCLRGDCLGDEPVIKIFDSLKDENSNLRVLNLFKNNLTDESIKCFSDMILTNRRLEEINLGNNYLSDESLSLIVKNFGIFKMTTEELEEYRRLEKERQDIIKQNAKLKASKKPEVDVPFLEELKEIEGEYFRVRNDILKIFNLIQNNFTEKAFDYVIALLDGNANTVINIEGKHFTEEQKSKLKDHTPEHNYGNRVFLLK